MRDSSALVSRARTADGAAALEAICADPRHALIALDYDGTLAPIVARPDQARAHPDVLPALEKLAPRVGQLAIVTGRPASQAVQLGGFGGVAGLTVLGHYGLERWHDGQLESPTPHPGVEQLREPLAALVSAAPEGTALEDKGQSLAVHTRRTADPQGVLDSVAPRVAEFAKDAELEVVPGKFVLELRPPGTDKGGALRAVVAETGARAVLFAGDDLGDLPAVAVLREMRGSGVATAVVCADSAETPERLREQSDVVVPGPAGVAAFLEALAKAL